MAFQGKQPFFAFLQGTAAGTSLEEAAPAENYILDERVPDAREDGFLAFNGFAGIAHTKDSWFKHHTDYALAKVARPAVSETFSAINQSNWRHWAPDSDVVRVETLYGLAGRAMKAASDVLEAEAANLIQEMLRARESGTALDFFKEARLSKWLQHVNSDLGSDRRPAFVAPFADVEDILNQPDWANRLRDALGLNHISPWNGKPMTVVLMQYNLIRVHNAHIGKSAWAASPTVLDDVPSQMPSPCFFPAPKKASADGYGYTVDLAATGATYRKEFLHAHIAYTLADIRHIGEVTNDVSNSRIADARKSHRELLKDDLIHFGDVPARP